MKLIRMPAVLETTGLKRSTFLGKVKDGSFPKPVKISERNNAWRLEEVQEWIASRTAV